MNPCKDCAYCAKYRQYACPECGRAECNKAEWHGNECSKEWDEND